MDSIDAPRSRTSTARSTAASPSSAKRCVLENNKKAKEDEEAERTEDNVKREKKTITPARQIIDGKAIVKLSGTTNFDGKEHDDVLGKEKTLAEKSSSKLETV